MRSIPGAWIRPSSYLGAVLFCLLTFWGNPVLGDDEIQYFDPGVGAIVSVAGTIEQESFQGLRFRVGSRGELMEAPASLVVDVIYDVPGSFKPAYLQARTDEKKIQSLGLDRSERLQAIAVAIKSYEELLALGSLARLGRAGPHFQFRLARLKAEAAFDSPAKLQDALRDLRAFVKEHHDAWQTPSALRLASRLCADRADYRSAAQIHRDAAGWSELPAKAKRDQAAEAVFFALLGKDASLAGQTLDSLRSQAPLGTPGAARVHALLALASAAQAKPDDAQAMLNALAPSAKEPGDRAAIWLMRGFCEQSSGRQENALWAFLHVDHLYGADRALHASAIQQLIKLFEARGDGAKADAYRQRLWREFAG